MSANISFDEQSNQHAVFTVGEAWHKLGQVVSSAKTSEEAIQLAHLDYEVLKAPHFIGVPDGDEYKGIPVDNNFGLYRGDTMLPLTINGKAVTKDYMPIQNARAFDFIDNIIAEKKAIFHTAGALGNGETVFITAKLPGSMVISGKDEIDKYLLITLNHDGTSSIKIKFTPVRVVCENTLAMALQGNSLYTVRHSANSEAKLKIAETVMRNAYQASNQFQEELEAMTKVKLTQPEQQDFIYKLFIADEVAKRFKENNIDLRYNVDKDFLMYTGVSTKLYHIMNDIALYTMNGRGQDFDTAKGTLYGSYNGVTGYYSNVKFFNSAEKRFNSIITGASYKTMAQAFNLAKSYI